MGLLDMLDAEHLFVEIFHVFRLQSIVESYNC